MKEKPYNLQVPIDKDLELALKELAKEDDRTLRSYCKRVLQNHVKNLGRETPIVTKETIAIKEDASVFEDKPKKKKVGALIKK